MLFGRKRQHAVDVAKEREIQAVRQETLGKIESATKNTKELNKLLKEGDGGITLMIWAATGGDKRIKR